MLVGGLKYVKSISNNVEEKLLSYPLSFGFSKDDTIVAIDFGNSNLRVSVRRGDKNSLLKTSKQLYNFPQFVTYHRTTGEVRYFDEVSLTHIVANFDCTFFDFKKKFINSKVCDKEYKLILNDIFAHYANRLNESNLFEDYKSDESICYISIPSYLDDNHEWSEMLKDSAKIYFKSVNLISDGVGIIKQRLSIGPSIVQNNNQLVVFNFGSTVLDYSLWKLNDKSITRLKFGTIKDYTIIIERELWSYFKNELTEKYNIDSDKFESSKYKGEFLKVYMRIMDECSYVDENIMIEFNHLVKHQCYSVDFSKQTYSSIVSKAIEDLNSRLIQIKNELDNTNYKVLLFGANTRLVGVKNIFQNVFGDKFDEKNWTTVTLLTVSLVDL